MKLVPLAAACALAASQAACLGNPLSAGAQPLDINKFLTDPACAHDDKIAGITGAAGVPASLQFSAERHCPGNAPPAPVVKPLSDAGSALDAAKSFGGGGASAGYEP